MNKEILQKLKQLKPVLKERYGIEEFALFGSQAREDYTSYSDVDIVILKVTQKNYFKRVKAKYFLEKELQKSVDIGYFDSMREPIKKFIKQDIIYV
ncbi:hypothetical protein NitYY0826_C0932 [Nitratiruptor sp. YY08-26]|uniref:nucleotidyltransferase family protein n=1 Tax=unclassified Nitratiruptor TaxID=2624044 RepID=UPI00191537E7|nr:MULTISPECIES: nucleotidyltransferase domain-containing protein [unclassified Nitratiruptor]BCD62063.1 hypothetical protein NitYY0813_C0930 [Nitratiruptor sp. YY08-13]BCD65999.1 hypothetical protein NitYY0826_C0932 [Nitratiruptor sp. YY08-26]